MSNFLGKCVRKAAHTAKNGLLNLRSAYYLGRTKKRPHSDKIRAGFIVQMSEIWDKEEPVYSVLKNHSGTEVFLLAVPKWDFETQQTVNDYSGNYFIKNYPDAIRAINPDGTVIDTDSLNADYIFYQRPYDHYLPEALRSSSLVGKTKCCYIPYGFAGADVFNEGNSNPEFFRNIYVSFLESAYMQKILESKFRLNSLLKLRHFENIGYPSLEPYVKMKQNFSRTILWTPRWSYDEKIGGSHFIEYKDAFLALKNKHNDWNLIFRPHPLMFDEFVSKKLMSQAEVDDYLDKLNRAGIVYDYDTSLEKALESADILFTDYSSVIVNYFLTGKPILYCEGIIELNGLYSKMSEGMYIVKSENEIEQYISDLFDGNDPLREKRAEIIKSEFSNCVGAAERIAEWIINDYNKKKQS